MQECIRPQISKRCKNNSESLAVVSRFAEQMETEGVEMQSDYYSYIYSGEWEHYLLSACKSNHV